MKRVHHIIIHSLLIFGLLALPMQNVWAMADMASCDMNMSSHNMSNMSISDSSADMNTSTATKDCCGDNHCNKCFHGSSVILTSDMAVNRDNAHQRFTLFNGRYLSINIPLESPPPIIA